MAAELQTTNIEERILDAAESRLARFGFAKTTMEDIAREAGLGRRTLYLHFASREDVVLCTIDRIVERLLRHLRQIAQGEAAVDERLNAMLVARVLFRFDSVREYHQNFNDMFATLRPAYLARRERYFQAEAEVFTAVITEGQQARRFRSGDADRLARTLLTATNSLLPFSLSVGEMGDRAKVAREATDVAALVTHGLRRDVEAEDGSQGVES